MVTLEIDIHFLPPFTSLPHAFVVLLLIVLVVVVVVVVVVVSVGGVRDCWCWR